MPPPELEVEPDVEVLPEEPDDVELEPLDEELVLEVEPESEEPPVLEPLEVLGEGTGFGAGGGSGEGSAVIAPTPGSVWVPRPVCSVAVEAGSVTTSAPSEVVLEAGAGTPEGAVEGSPTTMPGRAWDVVSADGSTARPTAASATATMIPRVRRVFMSSIVLDTDETPVKVT